MKYTFSNRLDSRLDDFFNILSPVDWDEKYHHYKEEDEAFEFQFNLAGFKRENINVNTEDGALHVKAEQEDKTFSKSVLLPEKADSSKAVAKYEDGLLYIKFNKHEKHKGVKIDVN